ncbi:hypothetical protein [Duganella lactea]|nr:hypothetical protein [Duganella lactea]
MMLQCAKECKFIFVMCGITGVNKGAGMAKVIKHRRVNIVVLEQGEPIEAHCGEGDIAILCNAEEWWIKFIGAGGHIDCYGDPYPSYNEALWSAKAAAEFGT